MNDFSQQDFSQQPRMGAPSMGLEYAQLKAFETPEARLLRMNDARMDRLENLLSRIVTLLEKQAGFKP
jgi:hypothetical protein